MTTATQQPKPLTIQEARDFQVPTAPGSSVTARDSSVTARDILAVLGDKVRDSDVIEYKAAAEVLSTHFDAEIKPNTLNARWFPKVWAALAEIDCPACRVQEGATASGNPKWKPTGWGLRALAHWYQWVKVEGLSQQSWESAVRKALSTQVEVSPVEILPPEEVKAPETSAIAHYQGSTLSIVGDEGDDRAAAMQQIEVFHQEQHSLSQSRRQRLAALGRRMARQDFQTLTSAYQEEMSSLQGEDAAIALEYES
ncbi:MAG: hypothetical protein O3A14_17525 [Cyanobacteria bacterium]|nr:hypothetical protein [Cyanobacteriota bacterium]